MKKKKGTEKSYVETKSFSPAEGRTVGRARFVDRSSGIPEDRT
jgi:hypothetical protein